MFGSDKEAIHSSKMDYDDDIDDMIADDASMAEMMEEEEDDYGEQMMVEMAEQAMEENTKQPSPEGTSTPAATAVTDSPVAATSEMLGANSERLPSQSTSIMAAAAVDNDYAESDDDEASTESHHQVREAFELERRRSDIFSFERYSKSNSTWRRQLEKSPETMKAKSYGRSISARRSLHSQHQQSSNGLLQCDNVLYRRQVHPLRLRRMKRIPTPGSLSMTLGDGQRVYLPPSGRSSTAVTTRPSVTTHALGEPMSLILARVNRNRRRQAFASESATTNTTATSSSSSKKSKQKRDDRLWVDKHAPRSWMHLLSEERTNRHVLRALKAWDPYVFGREAPSTAPTVNPTDLQPTDPKDKRPPENARVLLLSGPPGSGKTTLAHWVAQHAGYRPMEVNGSEDRSAPVLLEHIARAMESNTIESMTTDDKRPNCLILDEIDGADAKGAVAALVGLVRAPRSSKRYLKRPILLLCNNKFAPALRPILSFCRQFDVHPPQPRNLVARLRGILAAEQCHLAKESLLHDLVTATAGDIRSCLFTLQFATAAQDLTRSLEKSLHGSGLKDERNDVASCVTTVFRRVKKKRGTERVLRAVERFGDHSKLLDCLFLNIPHVSYIDPTLDRGATIYEWLSAYDTLRGGEYFGLEALHTPLAAGLTHVVARVERPQGLTYSTRPFADAKFQRDESEGMIQKFSEGQRLSHGAAVADVIPYIMNMLRGSVQRPVSSVDLLRPEERCIFDATVSRLVGLGLSYVDAGFQSHPEVRNLRLDPPLERLTFFGDGPTDQDLPAEMKQLLSRSINQLRIRSHAVVDKEVTADLPSKRPSPAPVVQPPPAAKKAVKRKAAPMDFLRMGAQKAKAARSAARSNNSQKKLSHTGSGVPLNRVIRLKYVKGFTQAVRTPCKVSDLL